MSKPMCLAPFHGLYYNPSGYSPCCFHPPQRFNSLAEYQASDWVTGLKEAHLSGEVDLLPDRCQSCIRQGNYSLYEIYRADKDSVVSRVHFSGETRMSRLYIAVDIKCNMSCGMCLVSDRRLKELASFGVNEAIEVAPYPQHRDRITQEEFEDILESIKTADFVGLYGGDQTMQPTTPIILDAIREDATVTYSTNGLFDTLTSGERVAERISRFKVVELTFSLDGLGELGKRARKGINYKTLDALMVEAKQYPNITSALCITISLYNVMRATEIFEELYQTYYATGLAGVMFLNPVYDPTFAALGALPYSLKSQVLKKFKRYKDTLSGKKLELFNDSLAAVLVALNINLPSVEWERFVKTCLLEERALEGKITPITELIPEYVTYFNRVIV